MKTAWVHYKIHNVKHEFLLRGFVRCANCGRMCSPAGSKSRGYVCTSTQNPSISCKTKWLLAAPAENAVWIEALKAVSGLRIEDTRNQKPETRNPLAALDKQIARLEQEMTRIVERSATADERAWQYFDKQINKKAAEIEKLHEQQTQIKTEQSRKPVAGSLKEIQAKYQHKIHNLPFPQRVELLKSLNLTALWDGEELKLNIYVR